MIACGAAAEVAALLARGLSPTLPVMRAIGVPELAAYVRDEIDLETAAAAARQATRNYAKRQLTWFRNQPPERSEEHTSELQSLMRISYAVFCLKKKKHSKQSPNSLHNPPTT